MWSRLDRFRDLGLLLLRLGFGLGFVWYHGWPKLFDGPDRWEGVGGAAGNLGIDVAPMVLGLLAALAETLGGLAIALGLFFRPAAFAVAIVMFVATLNHHITGQGTPAHSFKNFWVLVGLMAIGPGRYSVDHWLARRRSPGRGAG